MSRLTASHTRRPLKLAIVGAAAVAAIAGPVLTSVSSASAADLAEVSMAWNTSTTLTLPDVPSTATSVHLSVTARWSWKPTRLSICASNVPLATCKATVALTTPVQDAVTKELDVALTPAAKSAITIYNYDASVRVQVTSMRFTPAVVTKPAPTPTPTPTPVPTPKPTPVPTPTPTPTPVPTPTPTPTPVPTPTPTPVPTPTPTPVPTPTPTPVPTPTPTPVPTPTPTPTPVPTPVPPVTSPTTVGVPAGTKLTVVDGDVTASTPGQVLDGLDIHGLVHIKAPNVTIKNSIIRGKVLTGNMGVVTNDLGAYPFSIWDSSLISTTPTPYINGVIGNNFELHRVEISGMVDAVHITGSNVVVADSWLHDNLFYASDPNHAGGPSHADSIQIQAGDNIQILRNHIEGAYSSAVQTTQDSGVISNLTITNNRIGGGGCSVNIASGSLGVISGINVADNTFQLDTRIARCAIIAKTTQPVANLRNVYTDGTTVGISKG
jgi:hypothetical protein